MDSADAASVRRVPVPDVPQDIPTPAVVVSLATLRSNVAAMQRAMDTAGVRLRPHAKTHKCAEVARLQLEAGAGGLTVGTVGEAEVFADAGATDLFVAYPVYADAPRAHRLRELNDRVRLAVGVDSTAGVDALGAAMRGAGPLDVLVEVDSGGHRCGVRPDAAAGLAADAERAGLRVRGVYSHGGHGYRPDGRADAARDEITALGRARDALLDAGFDADVVSAGSTPTAELSARAPVTEERPGTYVFNDAIQVALGSVPPDSVALFVVTTVVSDAVPGQVIVDAGAKTVPRDTHPLLPGFGWLAGTDLHLRDTNDYHGYVDLPSDGEKLGVGDRVIVVPNHVCPTVNLHDELLVIDDGRVMDTWEVAARGRNQ